MNIDEKQRFVAPGTCFMLNLNEHEIILFINVKIPTIVGILTFINKIQYHQPSKSPMNVLRLGPFAFMGRLAPGPAAFPGVCVQLWRSVPIILW